MFDRYQRGLRSIQTAKPGPFSGVGNGQRRHWAPYIEARQEAFLQGPITEHETKQSAASKILLLLWVTRGTITHAPETPGTPGTPKPRETSHIGKPPHLLAQEAKSPPVPNPAQQCPSSPGASKTHTKTAPTVADSGVHPLRPTESRPTYSRGNGHRPTPPGAPERVAKLRRDSPDRSALIALRGCSRQQLRSLAQRIQGERAAGRRLRGDRASRQGRQDSLHQGRSARNTGN